MGVSRSIEGRIEHLLLATFQKLFCPFLGFFCTPIRTASSDDDYLLCYMQIDQIIICSCPMEALSAMKASAKPTDSSLGYSCTGREPPKKKVQKKINAFFAIFTFNSS